MKIAKWNVTVKDLMWVIICLLVIIAFGVGLILRGSSAAVSVLSGASTVVSIVLSIVAILYTMIEGVNSSKLNQDTIAKLSEIDARLKEVNDKLNKQKTIDKRIRRIFPVIESVVQTASQAEAEETRKVLKRLSSPDIKRQIDDIRRYINEDIEE